MSTPSFRIRNLDSNRAVHVYRLDEEPLDEDLHQLSSCAPTLPTGMEKDEETEHHLQRALTAQQQFGTAKALQIPIPLVKDVGGIYDSVYPPQFYLPQNLIHLQLISEETDFPAYDMDADDEVFYLEKLKRFPDISRFDFENIITKLEENSGQKNLISFEAAFMVLKLSRDIVILVYYYWVNKREKKGRSLILQVASEKDFMGGATTAVSTSNNPYVAFRKRVEKMQTRKNRKIDELYYQKMFRLRKEFDKALRLIHMLKNREKLKHHMILNLIDISRTMFTTNDYHYVLTSYDKMCRKLSTFCSESSPISLTFKPPRDIEGFEEYTDESEEVNINLLPPRLVTKTVFREVRPLPPKESLDCEFTFQRKRGCHYSVPLTRYGHNNIGTRKRRIPSRFKHQFVSEDKAMWPNKRPKLVQLQAFINLPEIERSEETDGGLLELMEELSVHSDSDIFADDLSKFC